jgi:hypothetical protein
MSRVNHSCDENADHQYIRIAGKGYKVLMAVKDIAAGEEITIAYVSWKETASDALDSARCSLLLKGKWGIQCPQDCVCRSPVETALVSKARLVDAQLFELGSARRIEEGMAAGRTLLKLHAELRSCPASVSRNMYDLFQIGALKKATQREASMYIRKCYDICVAIGTEKSDQSKAYKKWVDRPETHRNWC